MTLFAERAIHVRFQRTVEAFHNGSLVLTIRGIECDTISAQQFLYGTVVVPVSYTHLDVYKRQIMSIKCTFLKYN